MFFYLSKTIKYLTMPMVLISILFVLALILKNKTRASRCLWAAVGLFSFLSNDFIANEVAQQWELPATPFASIKKKYEFGIVLTGVTRLDIEPRDRVYFNRGADRVTHAVQLYKEGYIKKIIISGGSGSLLETGKQEADDLADAMDLMGIPRQDIIIERKSRNTHESATELATTFVALKGLTNSLLITSAYHMRRSKACFSKQGLDLDTFSTDFITHPRKYTPDVLIIPQAEAINTWQILIHEWVGMIAYKIAGYI
jgi:uncharacterized SAM-binding protein YcdF (DUF218 family)